MFAIIHVRVIKAAGIVLATALLLIVLQPLSPTLAATPHPAPVPAPTRVPDLILQVPVDAQDRALSCEAAVAAMVARFYRAPLPHGYYSWEDYFIKTIPLQANPHRGFRGNINGRQGAVDKGQTDGKGAYGYGVYAEPIATALQQAGIPAHAEYGVDYAVIQNEVRQGRPVLVWLFNLSYYKKYDPDTMKRWETDPETGQVYPLIEGEHILVVRGLSADGTRFLVNDPYRGRVYWVTQFNFWAEFEGMRVMFNPHESDNQEIDK